MANGEQVQVGAIIPLSGPVAPWGERVRLGLETANTLQGNHYEISFEDEGSCEPQKTLTAYRKLVNVRHLKVIFVSCLAGTEALAPVAAKDSVLLLSLGLLNDSTLKSGAKLVNLATEIGTEAISLAAYIVKENPKVLAGVFYADAFGQEFSRVLSEQLSKSGISFINREDAPPDIESFRSLIVRWKKNNVDVLVTTLADKQQVTLLKEMQEMNFHPKIISSYILECFAPSAGDRKFFEGIKYTHPVNSMETSEETGRFNSTLMAKEKPGQSTNINAFFAYDGFTFLTKGIQSCGRVDAGCLYKFFTGLQLQKGISGEMLFRPTGALARPYGLKQVVNGEFVWLEKNSL